jgi:hypothetical protein
MTGGARECSLLCRNNSLITTRKIPWLPRRQALSAPRKRLGMNYIRAGGGARRRKIP